jgi:hypothetical protein
LIRNEERWRGTETQEEDKGEERKEEKSKRRQELKRKREKETFILVYFN